MVELGMLHNPVISEQVKVSYVVAVRNRFGQRFWNCINSLLHQSHKNIEIIISIFGGETFDKINETILTKNYPVKVIYTPTEEVWNRGKALNIGIREATGMYVICTDIDCVFGTRVTEQAVKLWQEFPYTYIYSNVYLMDKEDWKEQEILGIDILQYQKDYNKFSMVGTGVFQAMHRDLWRKLGGYNHKFCGWGVEDVDLYQRVLKANIGVRKNYSDDILHQWHESEIEKAKQNDDKTLLNAIERTLAMTYGNDKGDL